MGRDPYADLPRVGAFKVSSHDIADGRTLDRAQVSGLLGAGGADRSPHLNWSQAPDSTQSFAVTIFDPDAPTAGGFWHWAAYNFPPAVCELATNASHHAMPVGVIELVNDGGTTGYIGAAPPPGHGVHHYWTVVHALDVPMLDLPAGSSPAFLGFNLYSHTLARAIIVPTYEAPLPRSRSAVRNTGVVT